MAPLRSSTEGAIPLICPGVIKPRFCWGCKEAFGAAGKTRPTSNVRKKQNFIPVRDGPKVGFEKITPFSGLSTGGRGEKSLPSSAQCSGTSPPFGIPTKGFTHSRESTVLPFSPIDSTDTIDDVRFPTLHLRRHPKNQHFSDAAVRHCGSASSVLCFVPGGRSGGQTFRKRRALFTASDRCALPRHLIVFGVRSFHCKRDGKVLRAPGQNNPPTAPGAENLTAASGRKAAPRYRIGAASPLHLIVFGVRSFHCKRDG